MAAIFISCPIMTLSGNQMFPAMQDRLRSGHPLGVYLLTGILRDKGYECDLLDWVAKPQLSLEEIVKKACDYRLIFLSANSMNWSTVQIVAKNIKAFDPEIKICIGGPHPTIYPKEVLNTGYFEAIFRGEADRYINLVYEKLIQGSKIEIPALLLKGENREKGHINFEQSLDMINYQMPYEDIPENYYRSLNLETSRGCPNACRFCSITAKGKWRGWSVEKLTERFDQAEKWAEITKENRISIVDDTFTTDIIRILELCKMLPERKYHRRITYDSTVIDMQNETLIEALEPFTSELLIGAEVSTEKDAKRINKAVSPGLIMNAAKNLRKYDMSSRTVFSFILGFPWDTVQDCIDKLIFLTNLILDYGIRVYFQWYWPMPGSPMWRQLEKNNSVSMDLIEEPGFFYTKEWFDAPRKHLIEEEIRYIDDRITPVKTLLNIYFKSLGTYAMKYSLPLNIRN